MQVIVFIFLVYEDVCSTRVLSTKLDKLTLVSALLLLRPLLQSANLRSAMSGRRKLEGEEIVSCQP
jgi:hypothetical protein